MIQFLKLILLLTLSFCNATFLDDSGCLTNENGPLITYPCPNGTPEIRAGPILDIKISNCHLINCPSIVPPVGSKITIQDSTIEYQHLTAQPTITVTQSTLTITKSTFSGVIVDCTDQSQCQLTETTHQYVRENSAVIGSAATLTMTHIKFIDNAFPDRTDLFTVNQGTLNIDHVTSTSNATGVKKRFEFWYQENTVNDASFTNNGDGDTGFAIQCKTRMNATNIYASGLRSLALIGTHTVLDGFLFENGLPVDPLNILETNGFIIFTYIQPQSTQILNGIMRNFRSEAGIMDIGGETTLVRNLTVENGETQREVMMSTRNGDFVFDGLYIDNYVTGDEVFYSMVRFFSNRGRTFLFKDVIMNDFTTKSQNVSVFDMGTVKADITFENAQITNMKLKHGSVFNVGEFTTLRFRGHVKIYDNFNDGVGSLIDLSEYNSGLDIPSTATIESYNNSMTGRGNFIRFPELYYAASANLTLHLQDNAHIDGEIWIPSHDSCFRLKAISAFENVRNKTAMVHSIPAEYKIIQDPNANLLIYQKIPPFRVELVDCFEHPTTLVHFGEKIPIANITSSTVPLIGETTKVILADYTEFRNLKFHTTTHGPVQFTINMTSPDILWSDQAQANRMVANAKLAAVATSDKVAAFNQLRSEQGYTGTVAEISDPMVHIAPSTTTPSLNFQVVECNSTQGIEIPNDRFEIFCMPICNVSSDVKTFGLVVALTVIGITIAYWAIMMIYYRGYAMLSELNPLITSIVIWGNILGLASVALGFISHSTLCMITPAFRSLGGALCITGLALRVYNTNQFRRRFPTGPPPVSSAEGSSYRDRYSQSDIASSNADYDDENGGEKGAQSGDGSNGSRQNLGVGSNGKRGSKASQHFTNFPMGLQFNDLSLRAIVIVTFTVMFSLIVYLIVFAVMDFPQFKIEPLSECVQTEGCQGSNWELGIDIVFIAVAVILSVCAYMLKDVDHSFNESGIIAFVSFNFALFEILSVITGKSYSLETNLLIQTLASSFPNIVSLLFFLYSPFILCIISPEEVEMYEEERDPIALKDLSTHSSVQKSQ